MTPDSRSDMDPDSPSDFPRDELQELVFQALELSESQGPSAVEELIAAHPEHAAALRKRLQGLRMAGLVESDSGVVDYPERLGDFRLIEPIGGGGMGVVYLAEQVSLGREVALKLVRPEHLYFPQTRERFRREVEVVARLSHPGIVPIYIVGEDGGLPYFAMERVEGCTLADVLRDLEGQEVSDLTGVDLERVVVERSGAGSLEERPELFRGSWEEACVRIVRDVAEALEHAHRAGVLHRDVKPSNIMLTPGGRVMLLDFGLASQEGGAEERITRSGGRVGSLPYLPPEQVDTSATPSRQGDVYALGVTLYELLSLDLPFSAKSQAALLQAILVSRVDSVQSRNPGVSWETATVCEVAMERAPTDRYAACGDMARDLTNVLEKRPLFARRTGRVLRARRWAERNPTVFVLSLLLFALLVTAPYLLLSQRISAANELAEESENAKKQLEAKSAQVVHFLEASLDALQKVMLPLAASELRENPHLEERRIELLHNVQTLYQQIVESDFEVDPGSVLDARLAKARLSSWMGLGAAYRDLGRLEEADHAYTMAIEAATPMIDQLNPWAVRQQLLRAHLGRAILAELWSDSTSCLEQTAAARAVMAGAPPEVLNLARNRRHMTSIEFLTARTHHLSGNAELARKHVDLAIQQARTDVEPREGRSDRELQLSQITLARVINMSAVLYIDSGRRAEALPLCQEAIVLIEAAELAEGYDLDARVMLCDALNNLGMCAASTSDPATALKSFERVKEIQEELFEGFPMNPHYRMELSKTLGLLAEQLGAADETRDQALEYAERGVELIRVSYEERPTVIDRRRRMGRALSVCGEVRSLMGDEETARTLFEEGIELLREAYLEAPDRPMPLRQLKAAYRKWGYATFFRHRDYRACLRLIQEARATVPTGDFGFHYFLGYQFTMCSYSAGKDELREPEESARQKRELQDLAFEEWHAALDSGWRGLQAIESMPVFTALQDRTEEFAELVEHARELEGPN